MIADAVIEVKAEPGDLVQFAFNKEYADYRWTASTFRNKYVIINSKELEGLIGEVQSDRFTIFIPTLSLYIRGMLLYGEVVKKI